MIKTKSQVWKEIDALGESYRKWNPGLTQEQAIAEVTGGGTGPTCEAGRALLSQYRNAPNDPPEEPANQPAPRENAVTRRVRLRIVDLRKSEPQLSEAQAFDRIWVGMTPDERAEYREAEETASDPVGNAGQTRLEEKRDAKPATLLDKSTIARIDEGVRDVVRQKFETSAAGAQHAAARRLGPEKLVKEQLVDNHDGTKTLWRYSESVQLVA